MRMTLLLPVKTDEIDVAYAERPRQLVKAHDRRISPALLEAADVLLAKPGKLRKLLLGQTFLLPDPFDVPPDQPAHIHAGEVTGLYAGNYQL